MGDERSVAGARVYEITRFARTGVVMLDVDDTLLHKAGAT